MYRSEYAFDRFASIATAGANNEHDQEVGSYCRLFSPDGTRVGTRVSAIGLRVRPTATFRPVRQRSPLGHTLSDRSVGRSCTAVKGAVGRREATATDTARAWAVLSAVGGTCATAIGARGAARAPADAPAVWPCPLSAPVRADAHAVYCLNCARDPLMRNYLYCAPLGLDKQKMCATLATSLPRARTGNEIKNRRRQSRGDVCYARDCRRRFLISSMARALAAPPTFTVLPPCGRPVGASLEAM